MTEGNAETDRRAGQTSQPTRGAGGEARTGLPFVGQADLVAGLAGTTSRIVNKAATILEEEIAAGIRVTQDLEKKYVDVEQVRTLDAQTVVERFRKDAHDVVDILIDLVNVASNAVTGLTERGINIGIGERPEKAEKREAGAAVPSLTYPSAVRPGEAVDIPMTLENESDQATEAFLFHSSDLVNTTGERISADRVSFAPEQLVIEPNGSAVVTVTVSVPEDASPGLYSGLLQAARMQQLRAILSIQIDQGPAQE